MRTNEHLNCYGKTLLHFLYETLTGDLFSLDRVLMICNKDHFDVMTKICSLQVPI